MKKLVFLSLLLLAGCSGQQVKQAQIVDQPVIIKPKVIVPSMVMDGGDKPLTRVSPGDDPTEVAIKDRSIHGENQFVMKLLKEYIMISDEEDAPLKVHTREGN